VPQGGPTAQLFSAIAAAPAPSPCSSRRQPREYRRPQPTGFVPRSKAVNDPARRAAACWLFLLALAPLAFAEQEKPVWVLPHQGGVHGVAFSSDGKGVLTACDDK